MQKTMTKPAPPLGTPRSFYRFIGKYDIEFFKHKIRVVEFCISRKIRLDEEGLTFLSNYYASYNGNFKVTKTTETCDNYTFTVTLEKTSQKKWDKT